MTGVTFADGRVVIVNDQTERRWQLLPDMADDASSKLKNAVADGADAIIIEIDCCDGERCRWRGDRDAAAKFSADLDDYAGRARAA